MLLVLHPLPTSPRTFRCGNARVKYTTRRHEEKLRFAFSLFLPPLTISLFLFSFPSLSLSLSPALSLTEEKRSESPIQTKSRKQLRVAAPLVFAAVGIKLDAFALPLALLPFAVIRRVAKLTILKVTRQSLEEQRGKRGRNWTTFCQHVPDVCSYCV